MRAYCTYNVMTFGDEREAEEELNEARRRERGDQRERERELEDQVRRVTGTERLEERVRRTDDRIVVHAAESFVHEVKELEDRGDIQETLHASADTNSMTALSI